ncbi:NAD(P)-binding protein [Sistotremastrum suecicum HHB10207 ss-3]|uniref:NAD(P)-binding protein n=1 Tax=Sistotremastrum suecicum HHB10207 ss-3 TaxID=1314776 RepID=A0A166CE15_9AGAM|nr:NAD(P)-binding protein [Sistotremastrum suecicum HHB10207 ss-3]
MSPPRSDCIPSSDLNREDSMPGSEMSQEVKSGSFGPGHENLPPSHYTRVRELYQSPSGMPFDENYALASTQSLKNKDIPEGGAKGTILPLLGADPRLCFEQYVVSIIDLLILGESPGIEEPIIDLYTNPELLFLGLDGSPHHRVLITLGYQCMLVNEVLLLGRVVHNGKECRTSRYGMTSLSVRQYVVGIDKHSGPREKEITKTVALIDGWGVLAGPQGLDRQELVRLAKKRVPVANFDRSKLSKDGYLVLVEDQDVRLPHGELVVDGTDFRNSAHLRFKADLFVPCGGRPEAVNISNVAALVDHDGKPHFKYIVEGANLFLTQQARIFLERNKVVLFKDSNANKGGVTSSSLEILAGLGLSNEQYMDLMIFKDGKPSTFYQKYVLDIQKKISEDAAAEFQCIMKEFDRLKGAKARTLISDELSSKLNDLQAELEASDLFDDVPSRRAVMRRAIPETLVEEIGLDELLTRLPEPYPKDLFSNWVASHYASPSFTFALELVHTRRT